MDLSLQVRADFPVRGLLVALSLAFGLALSGCGESPEVAPADSAGTPTVDVTTHSPDRLEPVAPGADTPTPDADVVSTPAEMPTEQASAESGSRSDSNSEPAAIAVTSSETKLSPPEKLPQSETDNTEASTESDQPVHTTSPDSALDAAAKLEEQLAAFTIPPAWLDDVRPKWNTSKPWKEARQEIRNLLGKGDDVSRRQGIKLTWDYLQKNDIGDGHEYGMYMFLGSEPLWAIHVYRDWLAKDDHSYPPYFGIKALAALYAKYGVFEEAEKVLTRGSTFKSPDPKWNEVRAAELNDAFGDLYSAWGKVDQAKARYQEAARLFPLGKPPYGRHLLPRKAKKVQAKLDLLSQESLEGTSLKDGQYRETALGYSGDIQLVVQVKGGRMASVRVTKHQEKIDQNACVLIPQRISEAQSLQVDGISGATVTRDAIVSGTLSALKKAGLK